MGGKSCFFIGHRETSEEVYPELYAAVEQHIVEYGVTEFIVGHYGGFDRLAAKAVIEAKKTHPGVVDPASSVSPCRAPCGPSRRL